jgi:hypothetical protein
MKIFKHQQWHILILGGLLFTLCSYLETDTTVLNGDLWGISTLTWATFAILAPIIHQCYVLVCWRSELHYQGLSRLFGKNGFKFYKTGFSILAFSRPVLIVLLAISSSMTLSVNPMFSYVLSWLLLIPAVYLFYSVKKYFGFDRAFGIDHFYPEEYRLKPFVDQGIFKYTRNGMYTFGFFLVWVPGFLLQSKAALLLALFSHLYIWVHYYFTELPDIKIIYKDA